MELLKKRIQEEGRILPGNIVKVDGFLNHRIDTGLMREIAKEFRRRFDLDGVTLADLMVSGPQGGDYVI